jgi:hypothetical protein
MNEDVHGADATYRHKNRNGITLAKMVNFMVKAYVRNLRLYTELPFAGTAKKKNTSTVMVKKQCSINNNNDDDDDVDSDDDDDENRVLGSR